MPFCCFAGKLFLQLKYPLAYQQLRPHGPLLASLLLSSIPNASLPVYLLLYTTTQQPFVILPVAFLIGTTLCPALASKCLAATPYLSPAAGRKPCKTSAFADAASYSTMNSQPGSTSALGRRSAKRNLMERAGMLSCCPAAKLSCRPATLLVLPHPLNPYLLAICSSHKR